MKLEWLRIRPSLLVVVGIVGVAGVIAVVVHQWPTLSSGQATVIGGLGVLAAAGITFLSQHLTRASEEKRSLKSLAEQQRAGQQTNDREIARSLHERYLTAANQLAHESASVRLGGVYALRSLADDWGRFGNDEERQVCIDLMRAHLWLPWKSDGVSDVATTPAADAGEAEVRQTIVRIIAGRRLLADGDPKSWATANTDMTRVILSGLDLSGIVLRKAKLGAAQLARVDLSGADLSGADLTEANLEKARLIDATLIGATLTRANLSGANLRNARLNDVHLDRAILIEATLIKVDLTRAKVTEATLHKANLTEAFSTERADLTYAELLSATLDYVKLREVILTGARLNNAIAKGADLRGASLISANLSGANLTDANLTDAVLKNATMDNRTILTRVVLTDAQLKSVDRTQSAD